MYQYFRGEKTESTIVLVASILFVAISIYFIFVMNQSFTKGLGTVLVITGLIGGIAGGGIVYRTDSQVVQLKELYEQQRSSLVEVEGQRIQTVVDNFKYYKFAYYLAIAASLVLSLFLKGPYWKGVSVGLLIFAAMGLTIDFFAEERAHFYLKSVNNLM